jgi:hypothetical protein
MGGGKGLIQQRKKSASFFAYFCSITVFEAGHVELSGERFRKAYFRQRNASKISKGFRSMLFSKSRDEVDAGKYLQCKKMLLN